MKKGVAMSDQVKQGIEKSLSEFVGAVERTSNLEIVFEGQDNNGNDILVVENSDIATDIEGHQCTVDVNEIFAKVTDCKSAQGFIDVINGDRNDIVCEGVTRIVGYYSRVSNWNASKIGELRDRQNGNYGTPGHVKQHHEESMQVVNSLS
jgi:hypothetical protein